MIEKIKRYFQAKMLALIATLMALFGPASSARFNQIVAFNTDKRGSVDIADVIIMCVAFLVASYILPVGITQIFNIDVSTWPSIIQTLWQVLFPLLGVLAVALYFFYAIKRPS